MYSISERPRRLRQNQAWRSMVQETRLSRSNLVWPIFVLEGIDRSQPIATMPGVEKHSVDRWLQILPSFLDQGLNAIAIFPVISDSLKTSDAREALNPRGLVPTAVRAFKEKFPTLQVITDIALDPFSSDGHDGLVRDGQVVNDATLDVLAEMAVVHGQAGADAVAPSDMMDGRVGVIREALDRKGLSDRLIIAYTAKYASAFYGPFREALDSAPRAGDKKSYQMDFHNSREAIREARLDWEQGADVVMVKPGLPYLDVIYQISNQIDVPVAAYQVSGEYAQIAHASRAGAGDEIALAIESLTALRRAGASVIFSYYTPVVLKLLGA